MKSPLPVVRISTRRRRVVATALGAMIVAAANAIPLWTVGPGARSGTQAPRTPGSSGPRSLGPQPGAAGTPARAGIIDDGSPGCSTAQASQPALHNVATAMISVNGPPFDVSVLGDTSFVSLGSSIDVFSDRSFAPVLRHTVSLAPRVAGLALTPDGHHLLAATDSGAVVLDTAALESGSSGAVVGSLAAPSGGGGIEVSVSPDGHFAFVTLEGSADLAVFDLQAALSAGFGTSHFVGTVPLQEAPVGMAISPDGRYLYATSEAAGVGPRQQGTLSVISLSRAEVDPAHSVLAIVTAGCQAVRVVTTGNGSVVWVTARASDPLLGFSAAKLLSDPAHALVATVAVGEAPVGLAVLRSGNLIVVANSNRFGTQGATASLSVVNVTTALAGGPAVVGEITAGHFPRQFASEPNGRTLLVTNYDSGQLEAVDVSALPI